MLKCLFSSILFILTIGICNCQSQSTVDTTATTVDSSLAMGDSSSAAGGSHPAVASDGDSLYQPVTDTLFPDRYIYRVVAAPKLNKWLTDPDYTYANDPQYWNEEKKPAQSGSFFGFFRYKTVQWIIFLLTISLIFYGIFQLFRDSRFKWFSGKTTSEPMAQPGISGHDKINYDRLILEFEHTGNYRMAIRYMYLRLIALAREKNMIQIPDSTTNEEMIKALGSNPNAGEFRFLATAYEYIFYGEFLPSNELFIELRARFDSFQQKINN